jgi:hypothetical protein
MGDDFSADHEELQTVANGISRSKITTFGYICRITQRAFHELQKQGVSFYTGIN